LARALCAQAQAQEEGEIKISGENIIKQSAALRGEGKFDEAINLIESNIGGIDGDIKLNAWLEAFYAAKEKGDQTQAKRYASLAAAEDPNVPSIQSYL
jgi:SLT domain-containing protein